MDTDRETTTAPSGQRGTANGLYYDPCDVEIDKDPYPIWRRLRDEQPRSVRGTLLELDAAPFRAELRLRCGWRSHDRRARRGRLGSQRKQGVDTGAWWSDWALCLARTNCEALKQSGLTVFMFPIRNPGIEWGGSRC